MEDSRSARFVPAIPRILFLMLVVFFSMLSRLLLAPLLLRISADLNIHFETASLLFLSSSAGYVLGLLSSGFVAQRLTHKITIVFSLFLSGLTLAAFSRIQHIGWAHAVLFIGGWSTGLYPGSGIVSVTALAPDAHRGKALAVHECGPNFAFILAPLIAAAFAPLIGWRDVMLVVGISCIVISFIFRVFGTASDTNAEPPNFRNLAELARNRSFWVVSALFVVASIAAMGVYGVLPTYLVIEHELPERFVNSIVGASRITGFIAILSAGSLADRFGFRPVVAVILVVTGLSTFLLGVANGWLLVLSVFLQPLIVGAYFPVALNALASVTAPERRNLAVALAIPMGNLLGSGLAPPLLSALGARGVFSHAFAVLGVLIAASVALLGLMDKSAGRK